MVPVIDLNHLSVIGGHEDPELREIIDDFVAELADHLQQAQELVAGSDPNPPGLRDFAHKIRGMAGSLGFHPLAQVGARWDREDPEGTSAEWLESLRVEINRATETWEALKAGG